MFGAAKFVLLPIHSFDEGHVKPFVALAKKGQASALRSRDDRFRDKRIKKKVLSTLSRC